MAKKAGLRRLTALSSFTAFCFPRSVFGRADRQRHPNFKPRKRLHWIDCADGASLAACRILRSAAANIKVAFPHHSERPALALSPLLSLAVSFVPLNQQPFVSFITGPLLIAFLFFFPLPPLSTHTLPLFRRLALSSTHAHAFNITLGHTLSSVNKPCRYLTSPNPQPTLSP